MTEKLWLKDSYLKKWNAKIVSVKDKYIVLDKTAFYPVSGGQPYDTGSITADSREYKVVFSKDFGETVSHEIDRKGLKKGESVECTINWDRRYKLMRMHTSAHIISGVLYRKLNVLITGNQLGTQASRMDFNLKTFDRNIFKEIEREANKTISKNLPVTYEFIKREKALKKPELFKLAKVLPKNLNEFRIVKIGDFDIQADGGTHVRNTKEIGKIKITKLKNKGKDNRRLYWEISWNNPKF